MVGGSSDLGKVGKIGNMDIHQSLGTGWRRRNVQIWKAIYIQTCIGWALQAGI